MKKSDIAMIILIASIGVIIAYFIASNLQFLHPPRDGVKVQTITKIEPTLESPSKEVFNSEAVNPTVEVLLISDADAN